MENRYLQFLEGEEEAVIELFEKIKKDPRHYEVNKWVQGHTDQRVFSDWSMASWMLSSEELQKNKALDEIREFLEDSDKTNYPSGRFLGMIKNLMESWIVHGSERFQRPDLS